MSAFQFTSGPWRVTGPEVDADGAVKRLPGVVGAEHQNCLGETTSSVAPEVSTIENANLIAAAPDLYEAAKPLVEMISQLETGASLRSGSYVGDQYRVKEVRAVHLRQLREAMDKAEGRGKPE